MITRTGQYLTRTNRPAYVNQVLTNGTFRLKGYIYHGNQRQWCLWTSRGTTDLYGRPGPDDLIGTLNQHQPI